MGTKIHFNGVKGTGPLAEGSEGRQSLPFFDKTHDFFMRPNSISVKKSLKIVQAC